MGAIEHLTVALSAEAAERVRARVAAGGYSDESSVVEGALAALDAQDDLIASVIPELSEDDVEHWLRDEVVAICERNRQNPSRLIPIEQVAEKFRVERFARGE